VVIYFIYVVCDSFDEQHLPPNSSNGTATSSQVRLGCLSAAAAADQLATIAFGIIADRVVRNWIHLEP
jgi:hypothetical protein